MLHVLAQVPVALYNLTSCNESWPEDTKPYKFHIKNEFNHEISYSEYSYAKM